MTDTTGNLPAASRHLPGPNGAGGRELTMMRWGFPSPLGVPDNRPVTNIRNTASSYWRAWMKPGNRCLVPATSFSEYGSGRPAVPYWFALGPDQPFFAFAGQWRPWIGIRGTKADPAEGERARAVRLFDLRAKCGVAPIHPKAMPVILTTVEECSTWMKHPFWKALALQRPLADGLLSIVAQGEKQDPLTAQPNTTEGRLLL